MSGAQPERGDSRCSIYPATAVPILAGQLAQTASLLANRRGFVHLEASWNPRPEFMMTCIWLGKAVLAVDRISDRHNRHSRERMDEQRG